MFIYEFLIKYKTANTGGRRIFAGEETLIICLMKIAIGGPWIHMTEWFGGDLQELSGLFKWFIDFIFITFYNKISGRSLEMWLDQIDNCCQVICRRISQPPSATELQIDQTLREDETLDVDSNSVRVFGFIDCRDMWTTRTGSGPLPDGSQGTMHQSFSMSSFLGIFGCTASSTWQFIYQMAWWLQCLVPC